MFYSTRKSTWRRSALLVLAAVLVMTMLAACGGKGKGEHSLQFKNVDKGEVVATFKDGQVTQDELKKYLDVYVLAQPAYESIVEIPQFQEMLLEQYVSFKLLSAQASEESLKEARKQVDEQLTGFKELKGSDTTFADELKTKKISDADIATFLLLNSAAVVHMNSLVTDEDMAKAFETMKADFAVSDVRHILVQTTETDPNTQETKELRTDEEALARAKEVKAKLDAGGDWNELAKTYSDDGGSKENGGLYEASPGSKWVEPFKIATYEQEIGVIGEPVKSDFGYHVIKVEKREDKTLDQLTEEEKNQVKGAAAYTYMEKFMTEEMPKQELKITLPKAEEGAGEGEAPADGETPSETPADGDAAAGDEKAAE
ncbi:peptidylprolyl isomerase [Paenibacillus sp. 1011MAR3C5]|uniref:peptidylprolyl isomerase n=1 Tax=Paenibacillus sp. 1011MAR3C5 TaxID=1675787 RepID=UPI000E6B8897|nr:peptidylprolyl isomerase [Paenibacillus sp. 1011MAR3C5]RJE83561.1 peptidylprolyl isomerase [Paenibacillus sp. 1011MAR3C5]